jgi:hypothetical protein
MANGYVHVACRLPNGIKLRLYSWHEVDEPTPSGPRRIKVARPVEKDGRILEYEVRGYNPGFGQMPANFIVVPKWATTRVPKDFWDEWLKQSADSDLVKNRVVFAASTEPDLSAMIKEAESGGARSGLEPLNETNDARIPRGRLPLTRADEMSPPVTPR